MPASKLFIVCVAIAAITGVVQGAKPNFIIFLADDSGYADYRSFGHPTQEWTGVDRMVKEGKQFTQFYSAAMVCTPSRASLMTGRYAVRSGIFGTDLPVFLSTSSGGLPRDELTIPELLKQGGYATGMTGKWHLGINKENSTDGYHLPHHHGFDEVKTFLPATHHWLCQQDAPWTLAMAANCFLYYGDKIIEQPIVLGTLTERMLSDTKEFITDHKDEPFFYYMSFPQTHSALFNNERFMAKSLGGRFGDNINEMGWAIDEVLDHLVDLGIDKNTFALFLSDHGAALYGCMDDGSNGMFRGSKFTTFEGGVRIPAVAWWPGVVEAKSLSRTVLSSLDILPTFLDLADDDFTDEYYPGCAYQTTVVPINNMTMSNETGCLAQFDKQDPPMIFDVEADFRERVHVSSRSPFYPYLLDQFDRLVKDHKASIDDVESEIDKPMKPELMPCCNPPECKCNYDR